MSTSLVLSDSIEMTNVSLQAHEEFRSKSHLPLCVPCGPRCTLNYRQTPHASKASEQQGRFFAYSGSCFGFLTVQKLQELMQPSSKW